MEKENEKIKELVKRYNINLEELENEQIKLAKQLEIKDKIDFKLADKFGAIDTSFIGNKVLCCIIVCDKEFEIIDRSYVLETVRFPYLPGFRSYRELPAMTMAFDKLNEKPDVIFISAQGISHPRLGLASHFSLLTHVPAIGVANFIIDCKIEGEDILKQDKKVGKLLSVKEESKPMYVSPGNLISISSAFELSKELVNLPHKRPEPMHLVAKYSKQVRKELEV